MTRVAAITGAGSGVGRAIAIALVQSGWKTALIGRRPALLEETAKLASTLNPHAAVRAFPCDIGNHDAVGEMAKSVVQSLGEVEVLVNAAGTNAPHRSLEVLSLQDYLDTNLNGAYFCTQAFLPGMRQRGSGTIVNIVSDAGKLASPKAGPAYVMSKFGLSGLTQSINAEERARGVRACAIFPGDIDTPLLDKRPAPPDGNARSRMLRAEDVARCALLAIELPSNVIVEELVVRPR